MVKETKDIVSFKRALKVDMTWSVEIWKFLKFVNFVDRLITS